LFWPGVITICLGTIILFSGAFSIESLSSGDKVYQDKFENFISLSNSASTASSERYDPEASSNQTTNFKLIEQNLLFGIGYVKEDNMFLGDSTYISVTTLYGLIGLAIFLASYFIMWVLCPSQSLSKSLIFVVSLAGIAVTGFDHPLFIPFFAMALSEKGDLVKIKT